MDEKTESFSVDEGAKAVPDDLAADKKPRKDKAEEDLHKPEEEDATEEELDEEVAEDGDANDVTHTAEEGGEIDEEEEDMKEECVEEQEEFAMDQELAHEITLDDLKNMDYKGSQRMNETKEYGPYDNSMAEEGESMIEEDEEDEDDYNDEKVDTRAMNYTGPDDVVEPEHGN